MHRIRVLLVDDDEDDAVLVRDLLKGVSTCAYEVDWVPTYEQAVQAIDTPSHDVCLLDYRLGGRDGLELLRRARDRGYPAPIILLTGFSEQEVDHAALAADAADFLTKQGISGPLIDRSVRWAIRHRQDLDGLRESERQRRQLSAELLSAQERERRAVAREIHDGIGQTLAAATYILESTLVRKVNRCPSEVRETLSRVVKMLREVIEEASHLQTGLRPSMLDHVGIGPTLSWFSDEFAKVHAPLRVDTKIAIAEEMVSSQLKATIFRIVQEAFATVGRQNRADTVRLELIGEADRIMLVIDDNGAGLAEGEPVPGAADGAAGGLANMRERALLSGGTFELATVSGGRTRMVFTWIAKAG